MEELGDGCYWSVRWRIHARRAADVGEAVKVIVDNEVVHVADLNASYRLIADAQHFCARSLRRDVLVAPSHFVIEAQARNGGAACVELHMLGARHVALE